MTDSARRFLALHTRARPLLLPNPWDAGSAKLLASLGFEALATTSSGFAATLGRLDGSLTRAEALHHAAEIVSATALPVSADLENGFADEPDGVAETVQLAIEAGLAGCSIEDFSGDDGDPIYDLQLATARIAAAVEAAGGRIVLTARAENHLNGRDDLDDTIARLRAYGAAGADVLYAPGLTRIADIRRVVAEVGRPVNVLAFAGAPTVGELAAVGVKRISVGGAFAFAAIDGLVEAARELREDGTYGFLARARSGGRAARAAFGPVEEPPAQRTSSQPRLIDLGGFTLSSAREEDVHTLSLFGELDIATAEGVDEELARVEETDAPEIVIDLSGLTVLDSSGVRLLLNAQARAQRFGSERLTLRRGPENVQRVLELSGVEEMLPFDDD
jgi:anti-anti-sigma factor